MAIKKNYSVLWLQVFGSSIEWGGQVIQKKNVSMLKAYNECFLRHGEGMICYTLNGMAENLLD